MPSGSARKGAGVWKANPPPGAFKYVGHKPPWFCMPCREWVGGSSAHEHFESQLHIWNFVDWEDHGMLVLHPDGFKNDDVEVWYFDCQQCEKSDNDELGKDKKKHRVEVPAYDAPPRMPNVRDHQGLASPPPRLPMPPRRLPVPRQDRQDRFRSPPPDLPLPRHDRRQRLQSPEAHLPRPHHRQEGFQSPEPRRLPGQSRPQSSRQGRGGRPSSSPDRWEQAADEEEEDEVEVPWSEIGPMLKQIKKEQKMVDAREGAYRREECKEKLEELFRQRCRKRRDR